MSTLTKVLIVLLTLASIFLCGIVVTYIATATNYRLAYEDLQQAKQALEQKTASQLAQIREKTSAMQQLLDKVRADYQLLDSEHNTLKMTLAATKSSEAALQQTINGWAGVIQGFGQTIQDMHDSLTVARDELDKIREQRIDDRQRLTEITAALDSRIVELEALEKERRRLLEEKVALEKLIRELAGQAEKPAMPRAAVTPITEKVVPAQVITPPQELRAVVTDVDIEHLLAGIDIGSADGVELGMKFYVSRGDQFVCNILITDVEPEKAVGILELVRQPPKIGDHATNREPGT